MVKVQDQIVEVPSSASPEAYYAIRFGSGQLYTGGPQQGRYVDQEEAETEALKLMGGRGPSSLGVVLVNVYPVGVVARHEHQTVTRKRYVTGLATNDVNPLETVGVADAVAVTVETDEDALYDEGKDGGDGA